MVEPVDKQADSKQQHRTLNNATDDLWGWLELRLYQREIARDTHDKQEEGEHQVAGRHAVPLRVAQHLEALAPAIVHQYHACHGDTAQNVET